jgi:surfactin synthase thioesterase subunit
MALFLSILRADFTMLETYTYVPEAPFGCPLSSFGGLQDPNVSHADLVAWCHQVCGPFRLGISSGSYVFVRPLAAAPPHIQKELPPAFPWERAPRAVTAGQPTSPAGNCKRVNTHP